VTDRHHQWLSILAIGLAVMLSSAFAEDSNRPRDSVQGTLEKIDQNGKSLHIWVPGCEEDSVKKYPVRNTFLFGKARVGDIVSVTVSGNAQVVQEIKVVSPKARARGFLLLCRDK
jgi:hypothetical protein